MVLATQEEEEEVGTELVMQTLVDCMHSECVPWPRVLASTVSTSENYGVNAHTTRCPVSMKLFQTCNIMEIIRLLQEMFNFVLPSELIEKRAKC